MRNCQDGAGALLAVFGVIVFAEPAFSGGTVTVANPLRVVVARPQVDRGSPILPLHPRRGIVVAAVGRVVRARAVDRAVPARAAARLPQMPQPARPSRASQVAAPVAQARLPEIHLPAIQLQESPQRQCRNRLMTRPSGPLERVVRRMTIARMAETASSPSPKMTKKASVRHGAGSKPKAASPRHRSRRQRWSPTAAGPTA
jgi:hypothetical protein